MSNLQIVFVALPAGLMLIWLTLAALGPRKIDAPNRVAVLRHGPTLRTLALSFALLPPMVMIYVIAVFPWRTETMLINAGISFTMTCLIAGLALIEVTRGQVILTEDGITRMSPWRSLMALHWSEVQRVEYSSMNGVFVVIGAGHRMRVSRYLVGIKAFADVVKRKLGPERYAEAAAVMDAVR